METSSPSIDDNNDENHDNSLIESKDNNNSKKCFSPLPSRRFWAPLSSSTCLLCPSMDLMVIGLPQAGGGGGGGGGRTATTAITTATTTNSSATASAATTPMVEEGGATTIWLHRTVSAQKVASLALPLPEETAAAAAADPSSATGAAASATAPDGGAPSVVTRVCWRPDGRILALAQADGFVTLYPIEEIVSNHSNSSALGGGVATGAGMDEENVMDQRVSWNVLQLLQSSSTSSSSNSLPATAITGHVITGMAWAHVGRPHPAWSKNNRYYGSDYLSYTGGAGSALGFSHFSANFQPPDHGYGGSASAMWNPTADTTAELDEDDEENGVVWSFRSRYVDRAPNFLPPSVKPTINNFGTTVLARAGGAASQDLEQSTVPTSQTPLSVLCVTTANDQMHLFLHGRYPIVVGLSFPSTSVSSNEINHNTLGNSFDIAVSNQLLHFLLHRRGSPHLTLYSFPALAREKFNLQSLSALSCATLSYLGRIRNSIHEVKGSWLSSLKPLDLKLDALLQLLKKYGLDQHADSINTALLHYILSGHTHQSPNLSNAMDQFFTGVQMNDQLIQRMERSLTVAVAKVETQVRRSLLRPAQALVYRTSELHALARALLSDNPHLLPLDATRQVYTACTKLLLQVETALTDMIDARFRLRDFVSWLRSAGAQVKARGTAANSVQRQNAQKRRVSDAVVQRMLQYLQQEYIDGRKHQPVVSGSATRDAGSLTERILGLRFSHCFINSNDENLEPNATRGSKLPTSQVKQSIKATVQEVGEAVELLLQGPRKYMKDSVQVTQLLLQQQSAPVQGQRSGNQVALTMRLGQGGVDPDSVPFGEEKMDGFFAPRDGSDSFSSAATSASFRQWAIIAQVFAPDAIIDAQEPNRTHVQLHALPMTWVHAQDDDDSDAHGLAAQAFWSTRFIIPDNCSVRDISFYGDDGKSSLSSGVDSGTGKERRQSLGLLVERNNILELWLVQYDDCLFSQFCTLDVGDCLGLAKTDNCSTCKLEPLPDSLDDESSAPAGILYAKTRVIPAEFKEEARHSLMMSGSRGVGAVLSTHNNGTSVDLFDLEEEEEEEEDSGDEGESGEEAMETE